jgi:hypothetical protein
VGHAWGGSMGVEAPHGEPPSRGEEEPSAAARAVADLIRGAARRRELRMADLKEIGAAVSEAGYEVLLPRRPADRGQPGWLELERHRCGKPTCACARDPARRHLRVVFRWREAGRRRKKILGPPGKARAPPDVAAPIRAQLDRLNKAAAMDLGFLHD